MRLPADKVKEGILHQDQDAREVALAYFARSFSADPTLMPLAIQAIERFGFDRAFETVDFLEDLTQTDATVRWLMQQIQEMGEPENENDADCLQASIDALIHANVAVLQRFEAEILALDALDREDQDAITERLEFLSRPVDELWQELAEICQTGDDVDALTYEELALADRLAEALARHPGAIADKVLAILSGAESEASPLRLGFAARLAGHAKLEAALPMLVKLLTHPDDWLDTECECALALIGTDAAVLQIRQLLVQGDSDSRLAAVFALQDIHSDLSVQTLLERCHVEKSAPVECALLNALLCNFATEGIEPARKYILETPFNLAVGELRSTLLAACKLMGERFPEYEAWLAAEEEFRQSWQEEEFVPSDEDAWFPDDETPENDWEDEGYAPPPLAPFIRTEPHVGRNDPCPCGSGKKYKKCCMNKEGGMNKGGLFGL